MRNNQYLKFGNILILSLFFGCSPSETNVIQESAIVAESQNTGQSAVKDEMSNPNIVQVALGSSDHTTLVAALKAADYVNALTNVGPFTVFAPTNTAFEALPDGTVATLVKPENQRKLRDILEYHVLLGVYQQGDFVKGRKMGTADGRSIEIASGEDGSVRINGARILASIQTSNGVIHVIDQVLLPG
jgi:uncharacterized surface protein with fasciclin (FAS1) repeats